MKNQVTTNTENAISNNFSLLFQLFKELTSGVNPSILKLRVSILVDQGLLSMTRWTILNINSIASQKSQTSLWRSDYFLKALRTRSRHYVREGVGKGGQKWVRRCFCRSQCKFLRKYIARLKT